MTDLGLSNTEIEEIFQLSKQKGKSCVAILKVRQKTGLSLQDASRFIENTLPSLYNNLNKPRILSQERLQEIAERVYQTRGGEWKILSDEEAPPTLRYTVYNQGGEICYLSESDEARFIAACRQDVPDLLEYVKFLEKRNKELESRLLTLGGDSRPRE